MNWINPKINLPKIGDDIAVLVYHTKSHWPYSAQIYFGKVMAIKGKILFVINENFMGVGEIQWHFAENDIYDTISGWCHACEFQKPDFIKKDINRRK